MGTFSRAIAEAVKKGADIGFVRSMAKACDGLDNPKERCPMRTQDGCACIWVEWIDRPWWKRLFRDPPICPTGDVAILARIDLEIDGQLIDRPKDPAP